MTDHVEMLHLLAFDAMRADDIDRAQALFDASDYLLFLETSLMDEMEELISRIAALETELQSLR
jgi:hypothetical protein